MTGGVSAVAAERSAERTIGGTHVGYVDGQLHGIEQAGNSKACPTSTRSVSVEVVVGVGDVETASGHIGGQEQGGGLVVVAQVLGTPRVSVQVQGWILDGPKRVNVRSLVVRDNVVFLHTILKEIAVANSVVCGVSSQQSALSSMDSIATEIGLMNRAVLNKCRLVIVAALVAHHVEVDGIAAKGVGLAHAEHFYSGKATLSSGATDYDVSSESSKERVYAGER